MTRFLLAIICLALLIPMVGCGGQERPEDLPELTEVEVTITQNGTPVEGAKVIFNPTGHTWVASGITDGSGVVYPKTQATWDGVAAGDYKITVIKEEGQADADTSSSEPAESGTGGEMPKNVLPKKYAEPRTTDLEATVVEGEMEPLTFDLK